MNYSELAAAFTENNVSKINELLTELRPRLVGFLHIHMDASIEDAEDCAHEAILTALETIKKDKMRNMDHVLSFLLSACRNNYLNSQNKKRPQLFEDDHEQTLQAPKQLSRLLNKERQKFLSQCIEKLSSDYKAFISYWFEHPEAKAKKAAEQLGMSVANVWTKKHRIIKKLNECYQKKIKK